MEKGGKMYLPVGNMFVVVWDLLRGWTPVIFFREAQRIVTVYRMSIPLIDGQYVNPFDQFLCYSKRSRQSERQFLLDTARVQSRE